MTYVTYSFQYAGYFPALGFFIGLIWGFLKSNSNRSGAMGFMTSILISGTVGLVIGVVCRFFAQYVLTAHSPSGLV